jgi:S-adenosylmethionine synthetase family protein
MYRRRMEKPLVVSPPAAAHPDSLDVEIVERKGRGHPDTICDALAEAFSIGLSRAYSERFGGDLPSQRGQGRTQGRQQQGGEIVEPLEEFLAGRATFEAAMRSMGVVIINEHRQCSLEMRAAVDQQLVQALGPGCPQRGWRNEKGAPADPLMTARYSTRNLNFCTPQAAR